MSNLTGGSAPEGNSRVGDGRGDSSVQGTLPSSQIPMQPPQQQQQATARMRTPRDVMNERTAREARKRAEAEADEQARAEQQRRIDIQRRKSAERRAAAAQAQARSLGARPGQSASGQAPSYSVEQPAAFQETTTGQYGQTYPVQAAPEGQTPTQPSSRSNRGMAPPAQIGQATQSQFQSSSQSARSGDPSSQQHQQASQAQAGTEGRSNVSSFPHAFERWETLSSHWEGLTGYWIRKLQMNTDTIRRDNDVTREQMSRQITDLAAAGANLFHAVVELQRLRASSERKFQRWFFETRSRQERDEEELQRLRNELEGERQERVANEPNAALQREMDRRQAEMRRELQISKDEARRAWEELGRREQEERERQLALREGHPIFVGGVQVLPMSAISRGGSVQQPPQSRDPAYEAQRAGGNSGSEFELQEPSPTLTDPFTSREPQTALGPHGVASQQRGAVPILPPGVQSLAGTAGMQPQRQPQGPPTAMFYQQPGTFLHDPASGSSIPAGPVSDDGSEDDPPALETDSQGNIRYDSQGIPIPIRLPVSTGTSAPRPTMASSAAEAGLLGGSTIRAVPQESMGEPIGSDDEYDVEADLFREREQAARYLTHGQQPETGRQPIASDYREDPENPIDWVESMPRHQHPTRLSDVLEEEDERSRHSLQSGGGTTQP